MDWIDVSLGRIDASHSLINLDRVAHCMCSYYICFVYVQKNIFLFAREKVNTSTLHLLGKSNSTCTSNTLVLEHYPVGTYKYCERAGKQRPDQQQKQCDMRTPQFDTSVRFYTSISFAKSQFLISLYSSAAVCSGPWSTCWNRITFLRTTGSQPLTT
jgi:hypothetical protein